MKRVLILFAALFALIGCSQDEVAEPTFIPNAGDVYYASFEEFGENSRTYIDENIKLLWHEDDRISLFRTTLNEQWKFSGKTGDNAGGFVEVPSDEWVTGNPITTSYAVYPYLADTRLSNDEVLQIVLPAEQTYAENSFGRGANTMVAAAESSSSKFLPFRNAGGYLVVKLYGSDVAIKSIELKGNNNEILAGAATAEAQYGLLPLITMGAEGSTTITLNCGEGVQVGASSAEATSFWLVVPPVTFEKGFTITITDVNGGIMTKSTSKEQVIVRNEVKSMAAFEPSFEGEGEDPQPETPANNEIWYTSTDGNIITPYRTDTFGANIVSNTYKNGQGVMTFDSPVTSIGYEAFYEDTSLESITIPDSVTSIGNDAFNCCFSLESVSLGNGVTLISTTAFYGCVSLESITFPEGITAIGNYAFSICRTLESITIPNGVASIGFGAFCDCRSLAAFYGKYASADTRCLIVDGVLNAFAIGCNATEYTIPDSVTSIGRYAFGFCFSLESITIPDNVTQIGAHAFSECTSLKNVYCTPQAPPALVDRIFNNTSLDITIYVPAESVAAYKAAVGWSEYADAIVGYDFEKGEIVEEVAPAEPANNEIWYTTTNGRVCEITSVDSSVFGANLTSNEFVDGKGILTFDGDVTGIYFDGLQTIETLTLPASVEDGFFRRLTSLKQIVSDLASEDGRCFVVDGAVKGFAPSGLTEYTFPEGVTKIWGEDNGSYTYAEVLGSTFFIMKFVFPEGLTEIGYYAFGERLNDGASSGLVVELPSTLTTIADNAFCAAGLEQITLPANLKTIGKNAFNYNSLTSVVVPSNVTSIGYGAFGSNSELSSVTVEATNPCSIGSNVFLGCSDALNINVPSGNWKAYAYDDSWGEYAYYMRVDGEVPAFDKIPSFQIWYTTSDGKECQLYDTKVFGATLVSNVYENGKGVITFNGAVAQIGLCAFYGNTAARQTLTSITIPAFVRSIGEAAIANHPNLTAIYCTRTTPPTGADDMFLKDDYSIPYDGTIYVPTESVDAYKAAAYWSTYADQIVGYDFE